MNNIDPRNIIEFTPTSTVSLSNSNFKSYFNQQKAEDNFNQSQQQMLNLQNKFMEVLKSQSLDNTKKKIEIQVINYKNPNQKSQIDKIPLLQCHIKLKNKQTVKIDINALQNKQNGNPNGVDGYDRLADGLNKLKSQSLNSVLNIKPQIVFSRFRNKLTLPFLQSESKIGLWRDSPTVMDQSFENKFYNRELYGLTNLINKNPDSRFTRQIFGSPKEQEDNYQFKQKLKQYDSEDSFSVDNKNNIINQNNQASQNQFHMQKIDLQNQDKNLIETQNSPINIQIQNSSLLRSFQEMLKTGNDQIQTDLFQLKQKLLKESVSRFKKYDAIQKDNQFSKQTEKQEIPLNINIINDQNMNQDSKKIKNIQTQQQNTQMKNKLSIQLQDQKKKQENLQKFKKINNEIYCSIESDKFPKYDNQEQTKDLKRIFNNYNNKIKSNKRYEKSSSPTQKQENSSYSDSFYDQSKPIDQVNLSPNQNTNTQEQKITQDNDNIILQQIDNTHEQISKMFIQKQEMAKQQRIIDKQFPQNTQSVQKINEQLKFKQILQNKYQSRNNTVIPESQKTSLDYESQQDLINKFKEPYNLNLDLEDHQYIKIQDINRQNSIQISKSRNQSLVPFGTEQIQVEKSSNQNIQNQKRNEEYFLLKPMQVATKNLDQLAFTDQNQDIQEVANQTQKIDKIVISTTRKFFNEKSNDQKFQIQNQTETNPIQINSNSSLKFKRSIESFNSMNSVNSKSESNQLQQEEFQDEAENQNQLMYQKYMETNILENQSKQKNIQSNKKIETINIFEKQDNYKNKEEKSAQLKHKNMISFNDGSKQQKEKKKLKKKKTQSKKMNKQIFLDFQEGLKEQMDIQKLIKDDQNEDINIKLDDEDEIYNNSPIEDSFQLGEDDDFHIQIPDTSKNNQQSLINLHNEYLKNNQIIRNFEKEITIDHLDEQINPMILEVKKETQRMQRERKIFEELNEMAVQDSIYEDEENESKKKNKKNSKIGKQFQNSFKYSANNSFQINEFGSLQSESAINNIKNSQSLIRNAGILKNKSEQNQNLLSQINLGQMLQQMQEKLNQKNNIKSTVYDKIKHRNQYIQSDFEEFKSQFDKKLVGKDQLKNLSILENNRMKSLNKYWINSSQIMQKSPSSSRQILSTRMPSYLNQPNKINENVQLLEKQKLELPIMKILSLRKPIPDENCNFIITQSLSTENQASISSEDILKNKQFQNQSISFPQVSIINQLLSPQNQHQNNKNILFQQQFNTIQAKPSVNKLTVNLNQAEQKQLNFQNIQRLPFENFKNSTQYLRDTSPRIIHQNTKMIKKTSDQIRNSNFSQYVRFDDEKEQEAIDKFRENITKNVLSPEIERIMKQSSKMKLTSIDRKSELKQTLTIQKDNINFFMNSSQEIKSPQLVAIGASLKKKLIERSLINPNNFSTQFDVEIQKSEKDNQDLQGSSWIGKMDKDKIQKLILNINEKDLDQQIVSPNYRYNFNVQLQGENNQDIKNIYQKRNILKKVISKQNFQNKQKQNDSIDYTNNEFQDRNQAAHQDSEIQKTCRSGFSNIKSNQSNKSIQKSINQLNRTAIKSFNFTIGGETGFKTRLKLDPNQSNSNSKHQID